MAVFVDSWSDPREKIFSANVRDHRCPGAGWPSRYNGSEATHRLGRPAEGYSVDRIVRMFSFLSDLTPAGKVFGNGSDSGGLGNRHLIEVYFCGVCVIEMGGIKPKPRFDGNEYISAELTPLQWIRRKSCPFRLGRVSSGVILETPIFTGCRFLG
jgi:hypothetical protein